MKIYVGNMSFSTTEDQLRFPESDLLGMRIMLISNETPRPEERSKNASRRIATSHGFRGLA